MAPVGGAGAKQGWIPPSAREATATASLRADPAGDPLCSNAPSLVETGKAVAISIERQMREASKLSDEEEGKIGTKLERELPQNAMFKGKWDQPADVAKYGKYLTLVVQHLAQQSKRPGLRYRAHIAHIAEFNAAALPGGVMFVNTGLFESADGVQDEAELVAVLAHEITHVEKRHTAAAYQYAKEILGESSDDAAVAVKMLSLPLSTEYEYEADDGGIVMAVYAQYDPQAQVNLWRRFAAKENQRPAGQPTGGVFGGLGAIFSTHPLSAKRACKAMERVNWARDEKRWDRVYDGRTNVAERVSGPEHAY